MHIEYHKWFSANLGHEMELKVYGHYGKPIIIFPAQGGRFYEFEDFGMINACESLVNSGKYKIFTVDSLDSQTWANWNAHPADRARRHEDYDRYITQEVVPFMRHHCAETDQRFLTAGVSMGGYHSANFFFRHPDIFDALIAISGLYKLDHFIGDYMDETIYFNTPIAYLSNLNDPWYLDQYRQSKIVICSGQGAWEDESLSDTLTLKQILEEKGIPAWIDIWGSDFNHDWTWCRKMMPYFLEKLDF
jgi:esterase/lipase superfamily enzyme